MLSQSIPNGDRPATPRPFADAYSVLWSAGWRGILPLPPGRKGPPPTGMTGYDAPLPSFADVFAWAEERPKANVALRMAPGQVAVDVDAYGDKPGAATMTEQTRLAGERLPPTWRLTSRGPDNVSGRYLFRVPEGTRLITALPGVEMVQPHHRYSVCAPSINPNDGNRVTEWIDPSGRPASRVPSPAELPELPDAWRELLAARHARVAPLAVGDADAAAWFAALEPGPPCTATRRRLRVAVADAAGVRGSRFEATRGHVLAIMRLGEQRHHGVRGALARLREAYVDAVGDRAAADVAAAEFMRMARPEAIGLLEATPTDEHGRSCVCSEGLRRTVDMITDPAERVRWARELGVTL